jgi:hypothetical protein
MPFSPRVPILWLIAFGLLAISYGVHAFEHWEVASHKECVAHTQDDGGGHDGDGRHDHGCNSHDHAPAVLAGILVLTRAETADFVVPVHSTPPAARAASIDHPPQLS